MLGSIIVLNPHNMFMKYCQNYSYSKELKPTEFECLVISLATNSW